MSAGIAIFDFDGALISSNRRVFGQWNAAPPARRAYRRVPGFEIRKQRVFGWRQKVSGPRE
jgi:hypothetical protein